MLYSDFFIGKGMGWVSFFQDWGEEGLGVGWDRSENPLPCHPLIQRAVS